MCTESQWRYIRHWLVLIIGAETLMCVFNRYLVEAYVIIALLFFCGFALRLFNLYPGESEPLDLDVSGVALAMSFALVARLTEISGLRFLLIGCSSLIILPHFLYIIREK